MRKRLSGSLRHQLSVPPAGQVADSGSSTLSTINTERGLTSAHTATVAFTTLTGQGRSHPRPGQYRMGVHGTFVPLPDSVPEDIPSGSSRDPVFDWRPRKPRTPACGGVHEQLGARDMI
jgi:hypothetical protein